MIPKGTTITELEQYQEAVKRTSMDVEMHPVYTGLLHSMIGLGGEVGELQNIIKKVVYHGHELDFALIEKELGDCLWYLTDIANRLGISLADVATGNNDKLWMRYPNGFTKQDSRDRVE